MSSSVSMAHRANQHDGIYTQSLDALYEPLLDLVKKGDLDELKRSIANVESPPYENLINMAVGNLEILEFLLEHEKQAEAPREYQNELLIRFADNGAADILEILLRHAEDQQVAYALEEAIASENSYLLQALLDAGANINARDGLALFRAVTTNQYAAVQDLIRIGANVNTILGQTALSHAVKKGCPAMVRTLLNAGADLNQAGNTVLLDAVTPALPPYCDRPINLDILHAILEKKTNLSIKNECGDTPLHFAAKEAVKLGNINAFLMIWHQGADLSAKNYQGSTPLDILAEASPKTYLDLKTLGVPLPEIQKPKRKQNHLKSGIARNELLRAAQENHLEKVNSWIKTRQLHSEYDLGLAVIESIKEDNFEIFDALLTQSQQPLWIEHRREAIRIAADKNLRTYLTPLLSADPEHISELRGAAFIAAAKVGHRKLALDMLDGSSLRSLAIVVKNAAAEGDLELLETLLEPISHSLKQISSLGQTTEEKKFLLNTFGEALEVCAKNLHLEVFEFLQKLLFPVCKELSQNGHPEVINFLQEILGRCLIDASEKGHLEVVVFLLNIKEENRLTNLDKKIAISRAKLHGFQDILEELQKSIS